MSTKKAHASLSEIHETVDTTKKTNWFKRLFAFAGPAYMVSVGYMDPGNWATDIAGGSRYGYTLIWVLLMSNLIALLLQSLSARLGIVRGLDLAQASRETYPKIINIPLYILAEIAIAACDLAEVLGMAIGLQLLFDIPLLWGVSITVLDSFLLLFLMNLGIRKMEAFILSLVSIIGISFLIQMIMAKPDISEIATGFIPSIPDEAALYIAIGIIGATVMPHNLYLHSSLVQSRKIERTRDGMKQAIKFNIIDSTVALNLAFFVNAAILILAGSVFYHNGLYEIGEIQDAHRMLEPMLGSELAPILFAVALIASGQSSTITGTLAGQIIMEGYLNLRIQPWIRRLLTRLIAIVPAFIVIAVFGEGATGPLIVFSQVVLSLQLGFAIIPLIHFTSDKEKMHGLAIRRYVQIAAWLSAIIIVGLNIKLVYEEISGWLETTSNPFIIWLLVIPICAAAIALLLYVSFAPIFIKKKKTDELLHTHKKELHTIPLEPFKKIGIALDFSALDSMCVSSALQQGGKNAEYYLIHIVESAGAHVLGGEIRDFESEEDLKSLKVYADALTSSGYTCHVKIGYGNPKKIIAEVANTAQIELLVLGAHGHRGFKDIIFGTTIEAVRHKAQAQILVVK